MPKFGKSQIRISAAVAAYHLDPFLGMLVGMTMRLLRLLSQ